jgi:hypothetical protein
MQLYYFLHFNRIFLLFEPVRIIIDSMMLLRWGKTTFSVKYEIMSRILHVSLNIKVPLHLVIMKLKLPTHFSNLA